MLSPVRPTPGSAHGIEVQYSKCGTQSFFVKIHAITARFLNFTQPLKCENEMTHCAR